MRKYQLKEALEAPFKTIAAQARQSWKLYQPESKGYREGHSDTELVHECAGAVHGGVRCLCESFTVGPPILCPPVVAVLEVRVK